MSRSRFHRPRHLPRWTVYPFWVWGSTTLVANWPALPFFPSSLQPLASQGHLGTRLLSALRPSLFTSRRNCASQHKFHSRVPPRERERGRGRGREREREMEGERGDIGGVVHRPPYTVGRRTTPSMSSRQRKLPLRTSMITAASSFANRNLACGSKTEISSDNVAHRFSSFAILASCSASDAKM